MTCSGLIKTGCNNIVAISPNVNSCQEYCSTLLHLIAGWFRLNRWTILLTTSIKVRSTRLLLPVHVVVNLELIIIFCCVHKRVGNFYTAQTIQYGFEQRPFISCIPPLTFKIEFLKLPWTMRIHFQTHDTNLGLSDHLHKIIVIELIVQCSRIPWILQGIYASQVTAPHPKTMLS